MILFFCCKEVIKVLVFYKFRSTWMDFENIPENFLKSIGEMYLFIKVAM